jgi:RNA recognition motif-containing protein
MNIHVSNLSLNIADSDLKKLFSAFGFVNTAVIIRDKLDGRSKGTAMVDMLNDAHASEAIHCLDQTILDDKAINVSEFKYSIRDYKN